MMVALIVVVSMTTAHGQESATNLVLIDVTRPEHLDQLSQWIVPFYALYEGKAVVEVTKGQRDVLREYDWEWITLDEHPGLNQYFLLYAPAENEAFIRKHGEILDSRNGTILFRASPSEAEQAARYGFGLVRLSKQPFPSTVKRPRFRSRAGIVGEGAFLQSVVDNVSQDEITATLRRLQDFQTRYSFTDSCQAAAVYLHEQFAGFDLSVSYDPFEYNGDTLTNVVAVRSGLTDTSQIYILCGHYDSINKHGDPWVIAPGADDNASGAAAVVEAARVLSSYDFDLSIYFICFSGEEQGLIGSEHYAQWAYDQGLDIRGIVNLDMIAYVDDPPYDSWDINIYCDDVSRDLALFMADIIDQHSSALPNTINTGSPQWSSDHYPFAIKGYEAIYCIDAQLWSAPDWNPYYHSSGDTVGTLNLFYMTEVVKAAVGAMANLAGPIGAGDMEKPTMEPVAESQGQFYSKTPVFSNFGFDDNTALDDGWYQADSLTGVWAVLFTNVSGTSWDGDNWSVPEFSHLGDGSHVFYFKAKDDAGNIEGKSGELSWQFYKDTTKPEVPVISSPTHPDEILWYASDHVTVKWIEPYDLSGVIGYSYQLDLDSLTVPDETREGTALEQEYFDLFDGVHYFHCRAGDNVCLWGPTAHFRIQIDTEPPFPPVGLAVEPSGWSNHPIFTLHWDNPQDLSGIAGAYYTLNVPPSSNADGTFTPDRPCSVVTVDEGVRSVYLWLEDGAGNSDYSLFDSTTLHYDATPPGQGSIHIAGGADTTASLTVILTDLFALDQLSGMGPGAMMQFSNDGQTWAPAEPFDSVVEEWDLSTCGGCVGSGVKSVNVRYQDVAGNWSEVYSDDIVCSLPLEILTQTLPQGIVGFAYGCSLAVTGGWPPYTAYIHSGMLPPGLALDSTGIIFGLPDSAGVALFDMAVTDTASNTEHVQLSIRIDEHQLGDVNGDGQVDIIDVVLTVNIILESLEPTSAQRRGADCNGDSVINILDTICIVSIVLEGT